MRRISLVLWMLAMVLQSRTALASEARGQLRIQAIVVAGCAGIGATLAGASATVSMNCDFATPYLARLGAPGLEGTSRSAVANLQTAASSAAVTTSLRSGTEPGSTRTQILSIDF